MSRAMAGLATKEVREGLGNINDLLSSFKRSTTWSTCLDEATLRPYRSTSDAITTIALKGEAPTKELESHIYLFEWVEPAAVPEEDAGDLDSEEKR